MITREKGKLYTFLQHVPKKNSSLAVKYSQKIFHQICFIGS